MKNQQNNVVNPHDGARRIYRDYAHVTEEEVMGVLLDQQQSSPCKKKDKNFPERLHYVLSEMAKDGQQHVASWQPHGRCFVVHDQELFTKDILPSWFRQHKFASFQRQLNIYNFTRITSGVDKGGYYHELFLRGKQFLAQPITRIKIKGMGPRKPVSSGNLPNLYTFPFLPEPANNPPTTTPILIMDENPRLLATHTPIQERWPVYGSTGVLASAVARTAPAARPCYSSYHHLATESPASVVQSHRFSLANHFQSTPSTRRSSMSRRALVLPNCGTILDPQQKLQRLQQQLQQQHMMMNHRRVPALLPSRFEAALTRVRDPRQQQLAAQQQHQYYHRQAPSNNNSYPQDKQLLLPTNNRTSTARRVSLWSPPVVGAATPCSWPTHLSIEQAALALLPN